MYDDPVSPVLCPYCSAQACVPATGQPTVVICGNCGKRFEGVGENYYTGTDSGAPLTPLKTWTRKQAGLRLFGIGLLLLGIAALMGYLAVYEPLEKMRRHETNVSYSAKMIFFTPVFVVSGVALMVAGMVIPWFREPAPRLHHGGTGKGSKGMTLLVMILFGASLVPGWYLYTWFKTEVEKAGYGNGFTGPAPKPIPVPKMDFPRFTEKDQERQRLQHQELKEQMRKIREDADKVRRGE